MAEETTPAPAEEKPAKQSSFGLIIVIVVVSLVSSVAGAGLSSYLIGRELAKIQATSETEHEGEEEGSKEEEIAEAIEKGAVVALEPFVVNLADADAARYLRIRVSLMVDDKHKAEEIAENQALTQKVRDVILQTLTKKTSQELINEEGKNHLRAEIQEKVGVYFKEPRLMDVMFTEFVIQL